MNEFDEIVILLVEDNPNDAELVLRILNKQALAGKVHVVKDGAEALDYIHGEGKFSGRDTGRRPGVIFLDLRLPKVDGMEVLAVIKADERTRNIPVVVFTSSNEERDIVECYRLGVNSYVVKPVDYEAYSKTVAEMGGYWLTVNRHPV